MLDPNLLLDPISEDAPSGEDLEYDTDFVALEMAAKPTEERVIGDSLIPAADPDFEEVARQAERLLARTHDLRVGVTLANAELRTSGVAGFARALGFIEGALEQYWESVHPQLDEEDGDPTMRVNAVLALAARDGVLASLRRAPLIESRTFGRISLRDLEYASGDAVPSEGLDRIPDSQTVHAAFQDAGAEALDETLSALAAATASLKSISATFDAYLGAEGPDLDALGKMLSDIGKRLAPYRGAETQEEIPAQEGAAPDPAALPAAGGAITTPQDVKAALDRIMAYYARFEPSSPLPLLLARAKRLVSADFVTIMKDMAPEGVQNVALIGGFEPDEGEEGTY